MSHQRLFVSSILVLVAISGLGGRAVADDTWRSRGGTTSLRFNLATLQDLGLEVLSIDESARPSRPGYIGFAIDAEEGFAFLAPKGHFERLQGGGLLHEGGLTLGYGGQTVALDSFMLRPVSGPSVLELLDGDGRRWFTASHPQPHLVPRDRRLYLANIDLFLSRELASLVGRPDLEGLYAGTMDLMLPIEAPVTFESLGGCEADLVPPKDLLLTVLSSVSQVAREPDVRVALSLYAELTNLGPGTIPWFRSIEPDGPPQNVGQHPYLGLQMYHSNNGVLRQIGRSDLKHAFFATNTGCACPSGQLLFPGCDDAYGVSTNEDRHFLAPRVEMAASSGVWESFGSHFDDIPADDFRDHLGEPDHDDFEHRLVVPEADLRLPGQFFVEAWYLVQGDPDIFNSMGHRGVSPSLSGSVWSFQLNSVLELSSILDVWVDPEIPDPDALISGVQSAGGEGHLQLAVRTSAAAAPPSREGTVGVETHYEYALMNHDLDSAVTGLFIPLPAGAVPTSIGFDDIDEEAGNDWQAAIEPDGIRWTAPNGNEQPWGSLFNFRFDVEGEATVVEAELPTGGSAGTVVLATLAPGGTAAGPTLQIGGDCSVKTRLRAAGMTPNGRLVLYSGGEDGTTPIAPGERCPGTLLSLGEVELLGGGTADGSGRASFGGSLLAASCGQRFQVLDHSTCAVSNVQLAE